MKNGATVRLFNPQTDTDGAYRAFFSGFHHDHWPILDEADPDFGRDVVLMAARLSTHPLVVEAGGRVGGILFGLCTARSLRPIPSGLAYALGHLAPRIAAGRYDMSRNAKVHLARYMSDWGPYVLFHPMHLRHAEALLFCLHADFRSKGLGRLLMDRLFEEARKLKSPTVSLCTDTTMSWRFYENYGFDRSHTFRMKRSYKIAMPEIADTVEGIIYEKKT